MRQFSHKGLRIQQLSTEAKIIYSAFCMFSLAALAVSVLYYYALVDNEPLTGARAYYAGEVAQPPTTADNSHANDEGPSIELPDDVVEHESTQSMLPQITRRKLLEVTHFHLFTVPVFLLVIAHLFMLCAARPSVKLCVIISGVSSTTAHLIAPWLALGSGQWAWLMPVTGTWMTASMVVMTGWPLIAMWRPRQSATL